MSTHEQHQSLLLKKVQVILLVHVGHSTNYLFIVNPGLHITKLFTLVNNTVSSVSGFGRDGSP